ncbi:hypothetical protein CWB41_04030 [Methylovirgula ligni]|uniref:Uncharacterized protein n=1 Tax=Methylovirgula ligni TaxID=569860 RepID=A0A3D9Z034_9HYPH|nr:hypothetical protein [Methylovirgula ligni]QAY95002.1 hypothetical protein CWB41_04030 [Methylovirgula ligni]REF84539.1 hypothetical protein DES32_2648 [Methylovirgula ligni]
MALYAVGFGTSQFSRATQPPAPQNVAAQQSRDLSDALVALQAPRILATSVRASAGTQMATLCLVQPSDTSSDTTSQSGTASTGGAFGSALAAYATVLAD